MQMLFNLLEEIFQFLKNEVMFTKHIDVDAVQFSLNEYEFKTRFLFIDRSETMKRVGKSS